MSAKGGSKIGNEVGNEVGTGVNGVKNNLEFEFSTQTNISSCPPPVNLIQNMHNSNIREVMA